MAKVVKVAEVNDLSPGQGKVVHAEGHDIALFNVGGTFHAIHNTCLHRGGPLGDGGLEGATVTCPWHGWRYDVTTGNNVKNPAVSVVRFPVKVEGADVLVVMP